MRTPWWWLTFECARGQKVSLSSVSQMKTGCGFFLLAKAEPSSQQAKFYPSMSRDDEAPLHPHLSLSFSVLTFIRVGFQAWKSFNLNNMCVMSVMSRWVSRQSLSHVGCNQEQANDQCFSCIDTSNSIWLSHGFWGRACFLNYWKSFSHNLTSTCKNFATLNFEPKFNLENMSIVQSKNALQFPIIPYTILSWNSAQISGSLQAGAGNCSFVSNGFCLPSPGCNLVIPQFELSAAQFDALA